MKALSAVAIAFLLVLCACGGGGSTPAPPSPPPTPTFSISTSSLPPALKDQPYTATLAASGGTGTLTWTSVGQVPAGLTLSSAGAISGAPQGAGLLSISVQVSDSSTPPLTASKAFTIDSFGFTGPLIYNPGVVNSSFYEGNYVAAGGVTPISWSISAGSIPPGMQLHVYTEIPPPNEGSRMMSIVGVPTQAGTYSFTVRAQDSGTPFRMGEQTGQIVINPAPITITTKLLPHATAGQSYSYQLQLTGGVPPYTWSLDSVSDQLPANLSLDTATGAIHGVPAAGGYSRLAVDVTDGVRRASQGFNLFVAPSALPPRNDSLATATPIFAPTVAGKTNIYNASISPYGDPAQGAGPDTDYYRLAVPAGSTWTIIVAAKDAKNQAFGASSYPLDPVVEIVDANAQRLATCNDPFDDNPPAGVPVATDTTPNAFDDPCMNNGTAADKATFARLDFKVPGTAGDVTFYIRVFDWRGYARPDMYYDLSIAQKP